MHTMPSASTVVLVSSWSTSASACSVMPASSIYEGTTQLQVVAAIRYITNGTYLSIIKEMLENEVSDDLKALKERVG